MAQSGITLRDYKEADKASDYEYAAFVWNTDKRGYEQAGRPVITERLCRERFAEYVKGGWFMDCFDTSRVVFKRRLVSTLFARWEEIKEVKTMGNGKILVYALHGAWDNQETDGVEVLDISPDISRLTGKLEAIAENKAKDYITTYGDIEEEQGERYYEITDSLGEYAKFYITEHHVELSESLMGEISRDMEKIDRSRDIGEYIFGVYETGGMEPWLYEYMANSEKVMEEILQMFDKLEDCNASYNATLENAVEKVKKEISLTDEVLEFLWERLGDVPVDDDGFLDDCFMGYEPGTDREEIWHWFDEYHSEGVAALMNRR